jgi:Ca-activated chloride channel family protein
MQAQQAYQDKDFAGAEQKFTQPLWQGNAAYRNGDFTQAEQNK